MGGPPMFNVGIWNWLECCELGHRVWGSVHFPPSYHFRGEKRLSRIFFLFWHLQCYGEAARLDNLFFSTSCKLVRSTMRGSVSALHPTIAIAWWCWQSRLCQVNVSRHVDVTYARIGIKQLLYKSIGKLWVVDWDNGSLASWQPELLSSGFVYFVPFEFEPI